MTPNSSKYTITENNFTLVNKDNKAVSSGLPKKNCAETSPHELPFTNRKNLLQKSTDINRIEKYASKALHILKIASARLQKRPIPLNVALHVTYRCNQNCVYCDRHEKTENAKKNQKEELTADQLHRIARDFTKLGARGFLLDGGEPLLRGDLEPLLRFLKTEKVTMRLNTNGTLLPKRKEWLRYIDKIKISLDGPCDVHDKFRGSGTFKRALDGYYTARKANVETELTCVINSANIYRIPEILELAQKLRTKVYLQPARGSLFVGKDHTGRKFSVDRAVFQDAIKDLIRHSKHPGLGNTKASLRHFLNFPEPTKTPCSAGWITCAVDPYGRLSSCPMLPWKPSNPDLAARPVEQAFVSLSRRGCRDCWCARQVELNFLWGGELYRFL